MYIIFCIHSSVDGHLGYFHVLAIVNSAAMNIEVHVSFCLFLKIFIIVDLQCSVNFCYTEKWPSLYTHTHTHTHTHSHTHSFSHIVMIDIINNAISCSQLGTMLPLGGHLAMSGDSLEFHNQGRGRLLSLSGWRPQMLLKPCDV